MAEKVVRDRGTEFTFISPGHPECPDCIAFQRVCGRTERKHFGQAVYHVELSVTCTGYNDRERHMVAILTTSPPLPPDNGFIIDNSYPPCPYAMRKAGYQPSEYEPLLKK